MNILKQNMAAHQLVDDAREAFRPRPATPDSTLAKLMYEAGAMAVIEWMDNKLAKQGQSSIVVPEEEADVPDSFEGSLRRMARGLT